MVKKRNVYLENQYCYYFGLPKIMVSRACATKNVIYDINFTRHKSQIKKLK